MRIVAKKKDYYDSIQAMGQDLSLVYVREPHRVDFKDSWDFPYAPGVSMYSNDRGCVRQHMIGFCGTIYPCVELFFNAEGSDIYGGLYRQSGKDLILNASESTSTFCYSVEDVDAFMKKHRSPKTFEQYMHQKVRPRFMMGRYQFSHKGFESFFAEFAAEQHKHTGRFSYQIPNSMNSGKRFQTITVPIFVASVYRGEAEIVYNSMLRPFHFMRVKDPYTAFQDLRMWFSNQASPEKEIPVMSNEDNAARLGHGDKYSFRTPPKAK